MGPSFLTPKTNRRSSRQCVLMFYRKILGMKPPGYHFGVLRSCFEGEISILHFLRKTVSGSRVEIKVEFNLSRVRVTGHWVWNTGTLRVNKTRHRKKRLRRPRGSRVYVLSGFHVPLNCGIPVWSWFVYYLFRPFSAKQPPVCLQRILIRSNFGQSLSYLDTS